MVFLACPLNKRIKTHLTTITNKWFKSRLKTYPILTYAHYNYIEKLYWTMDKLSITFVCTFKHLIKTLRIKKKKITDIPFSNSFPILKKTTKKIIIWPTKYAKATLKVDGQGKISDGKINNQN